MQKQVEIKTVTLLCHKTSEDSQGRSLLCYSTEAGGLGAAISDFEQFRVATYLAEKQQIPIL